MSDERLASPSYSYAFGALSNILAIVGSLGTLAIAIGYISRIAYFRAIGATWIVREMTVGEIAFASSVPVLSLAIAYGGAGMLHWPYRRSRRITIPVAISAVGILADAALLTFGPPIDRLSVNFEIVAVSLISVGAGLVAYEGMRLLRVRAQLARRVATRALVLATLLGLFAGPILLGVVQARMRLVDLGSHFSCVESSETLASCLPAVYFATERIYCLGPPQRGSARDIIVVPWSSVKRVRPPGTTSYRFRATSPVDKRVN